MTEKPKKRGGRKRVEFDDKMRSLVTSFAAAGIPVHIIAAAFKTGKLNLMAECKDELAMGKEHANARVAASLFEKAMGNGAASVTACIFWLKAQAGWREASMFDQSPEQGREFGVATVPDMLNHDDWAKEAAKFKKTMAGDNVVDITDRRKVSR